MGQSLVKNFLHIVFSTKNREPLIQPPYENELHAYLGGICNNNDCIPVKISGHTDHVHLLVLLSKKVTLVKLVGEVKLHSSKWMKTKDDKLKNFYWQNGYGAFSINPTEIKVVKNYIQNQEEHHKKKSFQDEYRIFLNKYNVEYDEHYVWD